MSICAQISTVAVGGGVNVDVEVGGTDVTVGVAEGVVVFVGLGVHVRVELGIFVLVAGGSGVQVGSPGFKVRVGGIGVALGDISVLVPSSPICASPVGDVVMVSIAAAVCVSRSPIEVIYRPKAQWTSKE
jgi:hypothetical protein